MEQGHGHNEKGAGRKKVYNRGAFLTLQKVKKMHRGLLNSSLKKNERDPITSELHQVKSYLESLAYLPPENREDPNLKGANVVVGTNANLDIIRQHAEIIDDLIVKGHSIDTIKKKLYEVSKHHLHNRSIEAYRSRYKETDEYKERYEQYIGGLDSMRLYTKTGRLEELTSLYEEAYLQHKLIRTRDTQNQVLKILDQARREADSPAVYNFQMQQNNMQINGTAVFNLLHRETEKDLLKGLPLHEIVLGRIAAKTGVSPTIMMRRLHNSYYAKQAGMDGIKSIDADVKYPSEIMYDIEDMVVKHDRLQQAEQQFIKDNPDNDDVNEEASELKKRLLERIKQKRQSKDE